MRAEAEQFGIAKIVPPVEWNPTCNINMKNPDKFPTKLQQVITHELMVEYTILIQIHLKSYWTTIIIEFSK